MNKSDIIFHELAPSQIPEWYAYQFNSGSAVYNISFNHFFFTDIEVDVFCKTWQSILDRHDVFRICFTYKDGKPKQYLLPKILLKKEDILIDETKIEKNIVPEKQNHYAKIYALRPFDFEKGPLFKLHLIAYPAKEFQLIFTVHHIIWDETSTLNLIKEFVEIYNAYLTNRKIKLPTISRTYFDYVKSVNDALRHGEYDHHKAYWLDIFNTTPPALELSLDHSRPAIQTYNGNTISQWLPRTIVRKIENYLNENNKTLFILLLAILDLYFYRVTGQNDFVLGCPIAGREQQFTNLIGCFAVPMPIRCEIYDNMTFSELLEHVGERVIGAFEHYHYPCVELIENLHHEKDLSRPKLFSIMAGVQNNKTDFLQIPLERGTLFAKEIYTAENHGARFDLAIGFDPLGGDIKFFCTYNTDLFEEITIRQLLTNLTNLFDEVLSQTDQYLKKYSLVSSQTCKQILNIFNANDDYYNQHTNIVEMFYNRAKLIPENIAISDGDSNITYKDLAQKINSVANYLSIHGIKAKEPVALLIEHGINLIVSLFAILKIGATYVPINEEWSSVRISDVISQFKSISALVSQKFNGVLESHTQNIITFEYIQQDCTDNSSNFNKINAKECLAYIMFTSGTSGKPKAIPILHEGIVNLLEATQKNYNLSVDDNVLLSTTYSFDPSILEIFWPLCYGAKVVILPKNDAKIPDRVLNAIKKNAISVIQTVPTMLEALCNHQHNHIENFNCLRLIICGSAVMYKTLRDTALKTFTYSKLMNHYGPTEATVDALTFDCSKDFCGQRVPLGRPLQNIKIFILDKFDELVPLGCIGEICIASPGLTPGYLNATELNKAKFFIKQFDTQRPYLRLYRTGDLGKYDEQGNVYFEGRIDNQVKINGNRVELEEIEELLSSHAKISNAALQYFENNNSPQLIAFVELDNTAINITDTKDVKYYQFTLSQKPEMLRLMNSIHYDTWPKYFEGSPYLAKYWKRVITEFPEYQFCLLDAENNIAALANGIPLFWSGQQQTLPSGWDEGIELAFSQHKQGIIPNTILGLSGIVCPSYQGRGLSQEIVKGFRKLAKMHQLDNFLGPVRPVGMFEHGVKDVFAWSKCRDKNNEPLDYWLRVHERLGATTLTVELHSQLVEGTLSDWKKWTGIEWNVSGFYDLEDCLQPLEVSIENNYARYYDPIIWVAHCNLKSQEQGAEEHFSVASLRDYLATRLPAYMLPHQICLMPVIPVNENGKVNLKALKGYDKQSNQEIVLPKTHMQAQIMRIWQEVLETIQISIFHDFFQLGGQSLKVIRMLVKLEEQYGIKVSLQDFYREPTIVHLEKLIGSKLKQIEEVEYV